MFESFEYGDIVVVTTESGYQYVATLALAPGIGYYWSPLLDRDRTLERLTDFDKSAEHVGYMKGR